MLATIFFSNSVSILFETLGFDIKKIWVKRKFYIFCKNFELKLLFQRVPFFEKSVSMAGDLLNSADNIFLQF